MWMKAWRESLDVFRHRDAPSSSWPITTIMMGPGKKLVRIALRFILWTVLSWFLLLFLWCFLPSPLVEQEGDNGFDSTAYVSRILRAGKTLTRVYE